MFAIYGISRCLTLSNALLLTACMNLDGTGNDRQMFLRFMFVSA